MSIPALLRNNPNLRYLWWGQIVSQLGDWFNSIALYSLLFALTGSATSIALLLVLQLLPAAVVTPLAGVVIDRFDRRTIMIAADVLRGFDTRDAGHLDIEEADFRLVDVE